MADAIEKQITTDMKPAEMSRLTRTAMAIREKVIREGSKFVGDVRGQAAKGNRQVREA